MKRSLVYVVLVMAMTTAAALVTFAAKVGQAAPDFTAVASSGQNYHLADFHGKYVVLEWHNNGCPYTQKHYNSGNMQNLQKQWTGKGVVWFTVISSAPGEQGFVNASQENAYMMKMHAAPTAALLDPNGSVGHLYDARTTPQMIVIDPQGKIIYDGAIDNRATEDPEQRFRRDELREFGARRGDAGKAVTTAATRPYGCSVKYR